MEKVMQMITCKIGMWEVEARMENVGEDKVVAVISAVADRGDSDKESKHVVVFDHIKGCDQVEEAKEVMQRVLREALSFP
jgi:hypothetical protein